MNTIRTQSSGHAATLTSHNKATGAGHTPVFAGAGPGAPPLEPLVDTLSTKRRNVVKVRLSDSELLKLHQILPANAKGRRGISCFVRQRLFSKRAKPSADSTHYRLLAGIKNELQEIARLANGIENPSTIVEVLVRLASLDHQVKKLGPGAKRNPGL